MPPQPSSTCHHCCPLRATTAGIALSGVYDGKWKGTLENVCFACHSFTTNDHLSPIRIPQPTGHSGSPRALCPCPHATLMRPPAPDAYRRVTALRWPSTAHPLVPRAPHSCPRPTPMCFAHHQCVPTRPLAPTMHTAHPGCLHRVSAAPMPHRHVMAPTNASHPSPTCPGPHLRPSRTPNHAMCPPSLACHPCVLPPACHIVPHPVRTAP